MRKRSAYRPQRVDPLAAFRSASRQHPLDASQKLRLGVALRTHLEALRTWKDDELAFHNLANGVNVSMVLASESGLGIEFDALIGDAQQALVRLRSNGNRGRPGLNALTRWLDVYDAQLEVVSQQEAIDALAEVARRVERGLIFEVPA